MKIKGLIILHFVISIAIAQTNKDSIANKKVSWGLKQNNLLVSEFKNGSLSEYSLGLFLKKKEYTFAVGFGVIGFVEEELAHKPVQLIGGQITNEIVLYSYKDKLSVPISFMCSYYRKKYNYGLNNEQATLVIGNINVKTGVDYFFIKKAQVYVHVGYNAVHWSDTYKDITDGKRHGFAFIGGYPLCAEVGLKYYFIRN